MDLRTALFNWVQIKIVADARPDDAAAQETSRFFEEILVEDHGLSELSLAVSADDDAVRIDYVSEGTRRSVQFDKEMSEQLLLDINANPKYNEER